jgi:predicted membrane metal-binding protein
MDMVICFALILLLFLLFLFWKKKFSNNSVIIIYLAFLLSLINCHIQIKNFDDLSQILPFDGTIVGVVDSIPTTNNELRTKFYLKIDSVKYNNVSLSDLNARTMVTIYDKEQNYSKIKIADKIELTGEAKPPIIAKNPSQFDYAKYLKNHKTFSTFTVKTGVEERGLVHSWKILATPDTFSKKFLQKLNDKRTDILAIHKMNHH